jgi:hypothetical protein
MIGVFCPACGERVPPGAPQLLRDDVRWHLHCTTFRLDHGLPEKCGARRGYHGIRVICQKEKGHSGMHDSGPDCINGGGLMWGDEDV